MDDKEASTKIILEYSRFWVQKVLVPILVVLGLAGSIVTVVVLTRLVRYLFKLAFPKYILLTTILSAIIFLMYHQQLLSSAHVSEK